MDTASDYFGGMVAEYDSLIRRAAPRYDEMIERLLRYLPERAEQVLELGCGTGNLSRGLAVRYPEAALTFVDAAPEMLALTRARLAPREARFVLGRFEDLALEPGSFDLVTSCISLHHVRDQRSLLRALHGALAPGGSLRFADQLRGGSDANH